MIHAVYDIGYYRYVIDITFNGEFIGFRVGSSLTILYDSIEDTSNKDIIRLRHNN